MKGVKKVLMISALHSYAAQLKHDTHLVLSVTEVKFQAVR